MKETELLHIVDGYGCSISKRTSRVANKKISRSREYHPRTLCRHGRYGSVVLVSGIEAGCVNVGFDLLRRIAEVSMCRPVLWAIETRKDGRNALSLSSRSGEHGPPDHYPVTSFCRDRTRSRSVAGTPGRARPRGGCRRRRPLRSRCRGISAAGLRAPPRAG